MACSNEHLFSPCVRWDWLGIGQVGLSFTGGLCWFHLVLFMSGGQMEVSWSMMPLLYDCAPISHFTPRTSGLIWTCSFHSSCTWQGGNNMARNTQGLLRPNQNWSTITCTCSIDQSKSQSQTQHQWCIPPMEILGVGKEYFWIFMIQYTTKGLLCYFYSKCSVYCLPSNFGFCLQLSLCLFHPWHFILDKKERIE